LLIAQGAHPKYIQEQLGHSSIQITLDLYGHLFEGDHRRYVEALDTVLDATSRNPGATAESVTTATPTISGR
jgi:integrase